MSIRVLILTISTAALLVSADDEASVGSQGILDRYLEASKSQQVNLRGVSMDVDISAELPKLKKQGRLHALRRISQLGRITYDALRFEGDNTIKKELIARYLSTEVESTDKTAPPITPDYYKFRFRGLVERNGAPVYLFQISPKKKLAGTIKGEIWLDPESCLPVREAGRLAKNPSVFIKHFDFVRVYEIRNGMAVPRQTTGVVQTRLWGKAEMSIDYSNFVKHPETAGLSSESELSKTP